MSTEIKSTIQYDESLTVERPDYENEIIKIIRGSYSPKAAQSMLEDYHGSDIAQVMERLNLQERKSCTAFARPICSPTRWNTLKQRMRVFMSTRWI